jgi:hypothetical protein
LFQLLQIEVDSAAIVIAVAVVAVAEVAVAVIVVGVMAVVVIVVGVMAVDVVVVVGIDALDLELSTKDMDLN